MTERIICNGNGGELREEIVRKEGEGMSMLTEQTERLRKTADKLRSVHVDDRDVGTLFAVMGELREAADTIESLRDMLQETQAEANHWKVEQTHAYGNWEDAYKRVTELEANNGTRWHDLFGTPERAARTLVRFSPLACSYCALYSTCGDDQDKDCLLCDYDALLEWLKGEDE